MTQHVLFDPPVSGPGDYHAHIFTAGISAVVNPRYVPEYSAPLCDYLGQLARNGLRWGTLVQPSFLGTDNSQLLAAVSTHPDKLRGVVVLDETDPGLTCSAPADWTEKGVRGVRLNLIGKPLPALRSSAWTEYVEEMGRQGWHLEFQANAEQLTQLEAVIADLPCAVVIDHLGLPDTSDLDEHPLARLIDLDNVWVKASGGYRAPNGNAEAIAESLISRDFKRLVFGSDWPHTRFETQASAAWEWALRPEMQPTL